MPRVNISRNVFDERVMIRLSHHFDTFFNEARLNEWYDALCGFYEQDLSAATTYFIRHRCRVPHIKNYLDRLNKTGKRGYKTAANPEPDITAIGGTDDAKAAFTALCSALLMDKHHAPIVHNWLIHVTQVRFVHCDSVTLYLGVEKAFIAERMRQMHLRKIQGVMKGVNADIDVRIEAV